MIVLGPSAKPADFVREIPKQTIKTFDLVDVVAGGDGFSGRRNRGIDPTNGRPTDTPPTSETIRISSATESIIASRRLPFVDGVFIPDGRTGPVQVDSAGHTFDEFPQDRESRRPTTFGRAARFPSADRLRQFRPSWAASTMLRPVTACLFMHANKGITFDLEAIRRANPGCKLLRFRAVAGNTETVSETGEAVYADVWVLVDGQVRFQRREINGYNGAFPIAIPIGENDRFLTLAATDGGNGIECDWIMFGDPRLELLVRAGATQNAGGP